MPRGDTCSLFAQRFTGSDGRVSGVHAQEVVMGLFPDKVAAFSRAVAAQRAQLLPYLIAARVTPIIPSWFMNLASPILQVLDLASHRLCC